MATNYGKLPIIAKFSEITKYGEKITTIAKNVKKCKKTGQQWAKNGKISNVFFSSFF